MKGGNVSGMGVVHPEISLEMQSGMRGGGLCKPGSKFGLIRNQMGRQEEGGSEGCTLRTGHRPGNKDNCVAQT